MSATDSANRIAADWTTKAGLRAVVLMTSMGHHCGYVGVPEGHVLHGVDYSQPCSALMVPPEGTPLGKRSVLALICAAGDEDRMQSPEIVFDVHGGITYAGGSVGYPASSDGLWWYGYDCAHHGDCASPEYIASMSEDRRHFYEPMGESQFRDLDYCTAECESLARQIAEATGATA